MMPVTLRPHCPAEIAAAVERFSKAAEHVDIEISLDTDGDRSEVALDRSLMGRVLANLLVNAMKFTPEGGKIRVSLMCQ